VTLTAAGAVDRSLPVTKQARVVGNVIDDDKRPVAAAWVMPAAEAARPGRGPRMRPGPGFGAMSGPDGRFVVRSVEPDEETSLEATKKGLPGGKAPAMKLASGETKSGVVITIPRGIEVTGIVTDQAGTALSGVTVTAASPERGGGGQVMIRMMLGESAGAEDVQTGSDGRFSMRLAEGNYYLSFRREGFAPYRSSPVDVKPGVAPVEVTLQPGAEIAGRVVRTGGAGIDGVALQVMMGGGASGTTTGPDGSFIIKDLAPGTVMLMVRKPDEFIQMMRSVNAPASDLTIEVPKGVSVSGRVIDKASGSPVTEFSAGVSGESSGGGMRIMMQPVLKSFRTDDGTFQLDGLAPGPLQLIVSAPGYVQQRVPGLVLEEGKPVRDLEVALETGTKISGRVTGPDGKALSSVNVRQQRQGGAGGGPGMGGGFATTDAEGNYQLEAVEPGEKSIAFSKDGYPPATKSVTVSGREMKLDVQLSRGATVAGVVVTEGGSPVPGATVQMESATSGYQEVTTDANGAFRIDGVSEGRVSIVAGKRGWVDAELNDVDVAAATSLRLVLGQGGRITGRVTGLQSSEYSQVRVTARTASADSGATPDSTGAFTIEGAPTGTVRVVATKGAGFAGSFQSTEAKTVELSVGGEAMVDLEFRNDRVVSGVVRVNHAALGGASVRFNPTSPTLQTRGTATTDASGKYEVRGLADGDYEVTVFDATRMSAHNETRQVSGSASIDIDIVTATLRGRVTDSDSGSGVAGARISFEPKSGESSGMITRRVSESDASGSFVVDNIVPGAYTARAEKESYGQDVRDVTVGESGAEGVDFAIAKNDGIRLRLVDARSGTALAGAVRIIDPLGRTAYEGNVAASSEGSKISLAPGTYRLSVFAEGYALATGSVTAPSASTALGLTPGGTIDLEFDGSEAATGRLIDATGADYQRGFWMRQPTFRIDPGITTLRNIAPGSYTVALLDGSGNVAKTWPVNVIEGRTTKVGVSR
jgi:protocatechuate 3,4-dioxygenase beta subunit